MKSRESGHHVAEKLREIVRGQVFNDEKTLAAVSRDQSIYSLKPLALCRVVDEEDALRVVGFCRDEGIAFTPRGRGSGTAGACLGHGIILQFERESPLSVCGPLTWENGSPRVTCGAAVVHQHMQDRLMEDGFYLPADPTSASISLIGGNIGTKASGAHALKHGSIDRYIKHIEFITSNGEYVDTRDPATLPQAIVRPLGGLVEEIQGDPMVLRQLDKQITMKCASGYNFAGIVQNRSMSEIVTGLLVGSIGTLGVITRASFEPHPYLPQKAASLIFFSHLSQACRAVPFIRDQGVAAIEIINSSTLQILQRRNAGLSVPDGQCHMLMVEYEGEDRLEQIREVERIVQSPDYQLCAPVQSVDGEEERQQLWKIRKSILPTIRNFRPGTWAPSLVNDIGVPVENLERCLVGVEKIFADYNLQAAIYGHAGSGNLHLRPFFSREDPRLFPTMNALAGEIYEFVFSLGGTCTAEHGMGRLRSPFIEREWGSTIFSHMRSIKTIFDPENIANPGVIFSNSLLTDNVARFPDTGSRS